MFEWQYFVGCHVIDHRNTVLNKSGNIKYDRFWKEEQYKIKEDTSQQVDSNDKESISNLLKDYIV